MIANDLSNFIEKVGKTILVGLNNPIGQQITEELLQMKLAENPGLSVAEWEQTKEEFVMFLFVELMVADEGLMDEFAHHMWKRLRKEV